MTSKLVASSLICAALLACKTRNGETSDTLAAQGGQNAVDMTATHEWFVNSEQVRLAIGSIGAAMGYGYYWGCPPEHPGWVRSATESVPGGDGLGSYKVSFAPANAYSCPGDQPGLKATLNTLIVPWESMIVSAPKTLPKGQPKVLASMTCSGGSAGNCEIRRTVNVGYKTTTTNSRELSFGQELNMVAKLEFSAEPLGVGTKTIFEVGFKATFGQKFGTSNSAEDSRTESVDYRCPLDRGGVSGHTYVGRLISVPARIAVDYKVKALLIPTLTYDGFPRISDDHGNHWLDHPKDRKARQQQYGHRKLFFWREMDGYLNGGMMRRDVQGDTNFSWADLKQVPAHEKLVRDHIGFLFGLEKNLSGDGSGTAVTEIDDVICQWTDTSSGQKQTVAAKRVSPGGGAHLTEGEGEGAAKPVVPNWEGVPLDDSILQVLEEI